jgi:hypothetical protein
MMKKIFSGEIDRFGIVRMVVHLFGSRRLSAAAD